MTSLRLRGAQAHRLTGPAARFLIATSALVVACLVVLRSRAFTINPDAAAWGITFDLTISIPLLYWFFIVRSGRARAITIAPLFVICTFIASRVIPSGHQQFLRDLGTLAVPVAEVILIGALLHRLRRVRGVTSADPYVRIATATRAVAGEGRVADVIASEVAMLYYALFCWRRRPADVDGRAFTLHERSGWSSILICLLVLLAAESIGMHLLFGLWSGTAAWIWTGLDIWGALWLLGDYHALRLRRSSIDGEALHIRFGLRWSVSVPRENIASIEPVSEESQWKRPGVLKVAILEDPRWLITLREPVVAQGLAGIRKKIHAIALLPDQDDLF